MLAMTDLALAGAKPNSSFGDPSYPFSRGAVPAPTRKPPIAHARRTNSQAPGAQKNPRSECLTTGVTRLACSQEAVAPYVRKMACAIGKKTWCAWRLKRASVRCCAAASAQKNPGHRWPGNENTPCAPGNETPINVTPPPARPATRAHYPPLLTATVRGAGPRLASHAARHCVGARFAKSVRIANDLFRQQPRAEK